MSEEFNRTKEYIDANPELGLAEALTSDRESFRGKRLERTVDKLP